MSEPLHIEESTVRDVTVALFGKNQHTKLARSAVEYFLERYHRFGDARIDMTTLREFVEHLIREKGYN